MELLELLQMAAPSHKVGALPGGGVAGIGGARAPSPGQPRGFMDVLSSGLAGALAQRQQGQTTALQNKARQAQLDETARKREAETRARGLLLGTPDDPGVAERDVDAMAGQPGLLDNPRLRETRDWLAAVGEVDPMKALTTGMGLLKRPPPPTGFMRVGDQLEPRTGGPADPVYLKEVAKAKRAPVAKYSGMIFYDPKVGKYYQVNPKTNKREFVSPVMGAEITMPDGTKIIFGAKSGAPSGNRQDEIRATTQTLTRGVTAINKILGYIKQNPLRVGAAGALKGMFQTGMAGLKDLAAVSLEIVNSDIARGLADKSFSFDPTLPEMEVMENMLAYMLARANKPYGKLNRDDRIAALKDVQLTGFKSTADVVAHLRAVRNRFINARKDLRIRSGGKNRSDGGRLGGMTDNEIMRELNR